MSTSSDRDRDRKLIRIYSLALDKPIWDAVALVMLIAGIFNLLTAGYSKRAFGRSLNWC